MIFGVVDVDKFKTYISRRRLKSVLRMMAFSALALHRQVLLVFVIEIAIVGKKFFLGK